jgi:CheY-like chemotaxis protein
MGSQGRTWQLALTRRLGAALALVLALSWSSSWLLGQTARQEGELTPLLLAASEQARLIDRTAALSKQVKLTGARCPQSPLCAELGAAADALEANRLRLLELFGEKMSSKAARHAYDMLTAGPTSINGGTHLLAMQASAAARGGQVSFHRDEFSGTSASLRQDTLVLIDALSSRQSAEPLAALPLLLTHLAAGLLAGYLVWRSALRPLAARAAALIDRRPASSGPGMEQCAEALPTARSYDALSGPLDAVLRSAAQASEAGQVQPETLRRMREASDTLLEALKGLCEQPVEEAESTPPAREGVDLQAGIKSLLGSAERLARRKGAALAVRSKLDCGVRVELPREDLRRLVTLLLSEALPGGSHASGTLEVGSESHTPGYVLLTIGFKVQNAPEEQMQESRAEGLVEALLQGLGASLKRFAGGFRLSLPLRQTGEGRLRQAGEGQRQVLIVDDVAPNRLNFASMVELLGARAVTEPNGVMGVRRALEERYDLILMDISMPVMDGIEATRTIRRGSGPNAGTPIVAVTAHANQDGDEALLTRGFDAVIHKPLTGDKLARLLDRFTETVPADAPRRKEALC